MDNNIKRSAKERPKKTKRKITDTKSLEAPNRKAVAKDSTADNNSDSERSTNNELERSHLVLNWINPFRG